MMGATIPQLDKKGLRDFGLLTAAIVVGLFGLLLPWLFGHHFPLWPWVIAAVLATTGLAAPAALGPLYRIWMKIGHVLGWINTRLILALMYYLLLIPIGLALRLLGKDPMARRRLPNATSYRVISKRPPKAHLERPF